MPPDLLLAMAVMILLAVASGVGLGLLLRRLPTWVSTLTALLGTALLVAHATYLNGSPALATRVGSPNAIVWSNFSFLFSAVLVAGAWKTMTVRWQRYFVAIVLLGAGIYSAYLPLFGTPPRTSPPRVVHGVHRQTTLSTCSAAAAATLLGTYGIDTTETEMADLCLTREGGTFQLGLYRGLRLKAPGRRVEFLNHDFEAVTHSPQPVLVSLGVAADGTNPLLRRVGHSVVIFGRLGDTHLIVGDPVSGRYAMETEEFRRLWTGEALRLD
jgi:predicted double-glycine peptidase